eukprot:TRINITY_DN62633_c0_g1_i1.p1 TRINITY_DN62633_c0_g1~~TRINITY_DN62633_c0_g1_i1.p1  ORF type:complete len:649 (+),score=98.56 TRINITY_DN62633_c0_g1_i1:68-2014(+)
MEDDATCAICLKSLTTPGWSCQALACGHRFHETCLREMRRLGASDRCPLCRTSHEDLTPVQVLVDRLVLCRQRGDAREASSLASRVLELDSSSPLASFTFAESLLIFRPGPEDVYKATSIAQTLYNTPSDRNLSKGQLLYWSGKLMLQAGQSDKALQWLEEALGEGEIDALPCISKLCLGRGQAEKAAELALQGHQGGDVRCSVCLAYAYLGSQDSRCFLRAEQVCKHMIAGSDDHSDANTILAEFYLLQGRAAEAEKLCAAVAKENAFFAKSLTILAEIRMMQGHLADAQHYAEEALKLELVRNPFVLLGDICLIKGHVKQAFAQWTKAEECLNRYMGLGKGSISRHFIDPASLCESDACARALLGRMPFVGDFVIISGLTSITGQKLNGLAGTVTTWDHISGRIGVKVDGLDDAKAIKLQNLQLLSRQVHIQDEELELQQAVEVSLKTMVTQASSPLANPADINAQVSNALLHSRSGPCVVLHTLSRCPKELVDCFRAQAQLAACVQAMEGQGLSCQVNEGRKLGPFVFVCPEHYKPLDQALRLRGSPLSSFRCWHIFADEQLSEVILELVQSLPKKHKVYASSPSIVPLGFAAQVAEYQLQASILRTFIHIGPMQDGSARRTASTTEADPRKHSVVHRPASGNRD